MIISELFEAPQQCPECGGISFSDLILAEKKDACYHKVKASAKVWPSAYASGRLVQCRKKGAANYGNKSEGVAEEWSKKYKSSINCSHPKGFSQKAHCAGKKKHNESVETEMVCEDCGMCETHQGHANLDEACWKGYHKEGNKKMFGKTYPNCVKNEDMAKGQLELNNPDPVVVVQDLKGKILDKINLSVAAQKYKLGPPQNIKTQLAHQNYTTIGNYVIVSPMSGQPQDQTTIGQKSTFATTEGEQQPGADYRDPKEVDYDDEYDAMVARVKKLAGLGPMKTTYDPAKRQYRNMPTAQQPKK
jgi:hypothetical protein